MNSMIKKYFQMILSSLVLIFFINGCCDNSFTYPSEDIDSLYTLEPVAPVTDLLGKIFYTIDRSEVKYGYATYKKITFNHFNSSEGIESDAYYIGNGNSDWYSDEFSYEQFIDSEGFISSEVIDNKLRVQNDYETVGAFALTACSHPKTRYIQDFFIVDKLDDRWIIQIAYVMEETSDVSEKVLYLSKPDEVDTPALLNLQSREEPETYANYYGDYSDKLLAYKKIYYEQAIEKDSDYIDFYQLELNAINKEIEKRSLE